MFFVPVDVAIDENMCICDDVTLQMHKTIVRGLQGVGKTIEPLLQFKLERYLTFGRTDICRAIFGIEMLLL